MARVMILTSEGKNKAFEADNNGVQINIKHIAIGDGEYTPNEDMTALQSEKMRVEILSKELNPEAYQATLNVKFPTSDESFYIKEYGVFLDDGTLFAVYSEENPESPTFKNKDNVLLMPIALNLLDSVNPDVINIIDNGADLKLIYTEEFAQINEHFQLLDTCCNEVKEGLREVKDWVTQQIASSALIVPPTVEKGEQNKIFITSDFATNDNFRGTQDITVAQAFSDAEHTNLLDEVVITSGDFKTINFSNFPVSTNIFARVGVGGDKHLSAWTNIEFVSSSAYIETPAFEVETDENGKVNKNPPITISTLPNVVGSNDSINKVSFRVFKTSDNSQVGTTQETTDMTLPITFISDDLEVDTEYRFEVMCEIVGEVQSAWGSTTKTTTSTFNPKFDFFNDGSALFLLNFDDNLTDDGGLHNGVVANGGQVFTDNTFVFDGNNSIDLQDTGDINEFSISLKFKSTHLDDGEMLFSCRDNTNYGIGYGVHLHEQKVKIEEGNSGSGSATSESSMTLAPDTWYHLVIVRNGTENKIYIDGTDVTSESSHIFTNSTKNIRFGDTTDGGLRYVSAKRFSGRMDTIHGFNRDLTEQEVSELYNVVGGN